jgi:hypothetical protein
MRSFPDHLWKGQIVFGPALGAKSYCKICDVYVERKDLDTHLEIHLKERNTIKKKKAKEAKEKRLEAARLARENKKVNLSL